MLKISTSILSSNYRIDTIKKLNNTNTDYIHIDVMDNLFVPNYQFPIDEINELKNYSKKPLDIHLMTKDPEMYIDFLETKNIEFITIHLEIKKDIINIINKIKKKGFKVGISIKPNTDITSIYPYLNLIDLVLIMSVEPGFGGQQFLPNTIERIKNIKKQNSNILIEVDGGINNITIKEIKPYINIAVVGSYIIKNNDYNEAINNLKN